MAIDPKFNPFPGLRAFLTEEDYLFFGREEQVNELLSRLRQYRFLSVLGASGSGKSSLVRAGMLPALEGGAMTSAGSHWEIGVMRPGGNPVQNLAKALFEMDLYDFEEDEAIFHLQATLKRSGLGLVEAIKQSEIEEGANLLIVVDQFEELFRFSRSGQSQDEQAAAFVKLLLEASRQSEIPIYVAITMRSDYIGDCAQFPDLTESVNEGEYLVPRLKRDQRRTAIEGPIKVAGGEIAPRLTQKLLNDFGNDPDQLPILQHALMRMWDKWVENRDPDDSLDLQHYENIGGMEGALSQHADEVLEESGSESEKLATQKLFQALTERGGDNRGIRRPTRLADLSEIIGVDLDVLKAIVERFRKPGRTFIMPPVEVMLEGDTVIDISHESLMRVWVNLRQWVETESQSARIFIRLAETAQLHTDGKAGLYHDPDLQIALSWRDESQPTEAWGGRYHPEYDQAIRFLDESAEAKQRIEKEKEVVRQRELEQAKRLARAEQERAEEQTRSAGKLKKLAAVVGLAAVLAMVATVFALNAREQAQQNAIEAETAKAEAEKNADEAKRLAKLAGDSKFRAEESLIDLAGRSVLNYSKNLQDKKDGVALAWLNDAAKSVKNIPRAEKQLAGIIGEHLKSTPLLISRIKVNGITWPRGDGFAVSRDGNWIAATSWAASQGDPVNHRGITVQNVNSLEMIEIPEEMNIHSAALSADGKFIAVNSWRNGSVVWDVSTGERVGEALKGADNPTDGYFACSKDFHPNKPIIATVFSLMANNVVEVYDFEKKKTLVNRHPMKERQGNRSQTFFTKDGKHLVVVVLRTLTIFSTESWMPVVDSMQFNAASITAREAPKQGYILIRKSNEDNTEPFNSVSLEDGSVSKFELTDTKDYKVFEFSSACRFLALSRPNGDLGIYGGESLEPHLNLKGEGESVSRMDFSTNERYLAVAYNNRLIRILDLEDSGAEIHRLEMNNDVNYLKFIPGREDRLYVGDNIGTAHLYALKTKVKKQSIAGNSNFHNNSVDEWMYSVSPNQQWLIASRLDGFCYLANLNEDRIQSTFNLSTSAKSIDWSSDNSKVAILNQVGEITVLAVDGGGEEVKGEWTHFSLSQDGKKLAAVAADYTLNVLSLESQQKADRLKMKYPAKMLQWSKEGILYYSNVVGEFAEIDCKNGLKQSRSIQLQNSVFEVHPIPNENQLLLISSDALSKLDEEDFILTCEHQIKNEIFEAHLLHDYSAVLYMTQDQKGKSLSVTELPGLQKTHQIPADYSVLDFLINPNANSAIMLNSRGQFEQINLSNLAKLAVPYALKQLGGARYLLSANEEKIVFVNNNRELSVFENGSVASSIQEMLDYALWSPGIEITPDGSNAQSDSTQIKDLQIKLKERVGTLIQKAESNSLSNYQFTDNASESLLSKLAASLRSENIAQCRQLAGKLRDAASSSSNIKLISKAVLGCSVLGVPLDSLTNHIDSLKSRGGLSFSENAKFSITKDEITDGGVTYSIWYRPRFVGNLGSMQVLFSNESDVMSGVSLYQQNNAPLQFRFKNVMRFDGSSSIEREWTHVAITVDELNRETRGYMNGKLIRVEKIDDNIDIRDEIAGEYIIGKSRIFGGHFRGDFARLSVWNRVLTKNEIATDLQNGLPKDNSLKLCLIAESVTSGVLKDLSENGRDVLIPEGASFFPHTLEPHSLLEVRDFGVRFPFQSSVGDTSVALGFLMLETGNLDSAEEIFMSAAKQFVNSPAIDEELFGRSPFKGLELLGLARVFQARMDSKRELECLTKFSIVSGENMDLFGFALLTHAQSRFAKPLVVKRGEKSGVNQLDLRRFFNRKFGDDVTRFLGFGMQMRDNIEGLNEGLNEINGIPMEIGGAIQMQGFESNYNNYPRLVKGIQVGKKIDRAVALHTLVGVGPSPGRGSTVIKYHLIYENGTRTTFSVRNEIDVGGWYGFGQSVFSSKGAGTLNVAKQIANEAAAGSGSRRYLYHFEMVNPNPSKVVSTIEIESMCTTKAPLILAITVE